MRENTNEAENRDRRALVRGRQWLAAAVAIAVLLSGLNGLVQVGKVAVEYGCWRGWMAADCRGQPDRR